MINNGLVRGSKEASASIVIHKDYTYIHSDMHEILDEEGNPTGIYEYNEMKYTPEEYQSLISNPLKQEILELTDVTLDGLKTQKVTESKKLLEQYYKDNPLFSTVHNSNGEYYSVTSEKQSYLLSIIALTEQAQSMNIDFTPTWNATGEVCEPWTLLELKQLLLEISQVVYPTVSKQQHYEKLIKDCETIEELNEIIINYSENQDTTETE